MNSLWVVVVGVVVITLAYRLYAKRIDRVVIQADAERGGEVDGRPGIGEGTFVGIMAAIPDA